MTVPTKIGSPIRPSSRAMIQARARSMKVALRETEVSATRRAYPENVTDRSPRRLSNSETRLLRGLHRTFREDRIVDVDRRPRSRGKRDRVRRARVDLDLLAAALEVQRR